MFRAQGETQRVANGQFSSVSLAYFFKICIPCFYQAREKESEDYERQLEVSKRTYGNMEQQLTSEIKLLRKLN